MTDQLVKFSEGATGGFETTKISSKTLVRISKRVFRSWTLKKSVDGYKKMKNLEWRRHLMTWTD